MIPDRAPETKSRCLTMYAYQTMPMIPKPTNAAQRQVVAKAETLAPKCPKLPKPKPEPSKTRAQKVAENHDARNRREVAELFKDGPLTVNMVQDKLRLKIRESAAYRVNEWKARGLIVEAKSPVKYTPGRVQKWWRMK